MALERGFIAVVLAQRFFGVDAQFHQRRVGGFAAVGFRHDDPVAPVPVGVVLVEVDVMEIQGGHDVHARHRSAYVALLLGDELVEAVQPKPVGDRFQLAY